MVPLRGRRSVRGTWEGGDDLSRGACPRLVARCELGQVAMWPEMATDWRIARGRGLWQFKGSSSPQPNLYQMPIAR